MGGKKWEEASCRHAEGSTNANMQVFACNDTFALRQQPKSTQESSLVHAETGTMQPSCPIPRQGTGITRTVSASLLCISVGPQQGFYSVQQTPSLTVAVTVFSAAIQVLDVSGASVLASAIPDCHVYILENCGHSVVVERPRKTANLILEFLALLHSIDNNKKQA